MFDGTIALTDCNKRHIHASFGSTQTAGAWITYYSTAGWSSTVVTCPLLCGLGTAENVASGFCEIVCATAAETGRRSLKVSSSVEPSAADPIEALLLKALHGPTHDIVIRLLQKTLAENNVDDQDFRQPTSA